MNNETKTAVQEKKWWEPLITNHDGLVHHDWLCDNDGDWQEKADALWKVIQDLRAQAAITAHEAAKPVGGVGVLVWEEQREDGAIARANGFQYRTYSLTEKINYLDLAWNGAQVEVSHSSFLTLEAAKRAAESHHAAILASRSLLTDSRVEGLREALKEIIRESVGHVRIAVIRRAEAALAAFNVGEKASGSSPCTE